MTIASRLAIAVLMTGVTGACHADRDRHAATPVVPSVLSPSRSDASTAAPSASAPPADSTASPPVADPPVEQVDVPGDLAVFVVRGRIGGERLVFLHGLCGNPHAYALSFQKAAARIGTLVAIQGNLPCNGEFRNWKTTPEKLDERIEAAFGAVGDHSDLRNLIVIGYSSGGTWGELLTMMRPQRYTRAILIGNPRRPALTRLHGVRAAVMMAGQLDRHDLMKGGMKDLLAAGIPATFMVLPKAAHGEMGPDSERVMGEALDWLLAHQLAFGPDAGTILP